MLDVRWVMGVVVVVILTALAAFMWDHTARIRGLDQRVESAIRRRRTSHAEQLIRRKTNLQETGRIIVLVGLFLAFAALIVLAVLLLNSAIGEIVQNSGKPQPPPAKFRPSLGTVGLSVGLLGVAGGVALVWQALRSMQNFMSGAYDHHAVGAERSYKLARFAAYCGAAISAVSLLVSAAGVMVDWLLSRGGTDRPGNSEYVLLQPVPFIVSGDVGGSGPSAWAEIIGDPRGPVVSVVFFENGSSVIPNKDSTRKSLEALVASVSKCQAPDHKPLLTVYATASSAEFVGDADRKRNVILTNARIEAIRTLLDSVPMRSSVDVLNAPVADNEDVAVRRIIKDNLNSKVRNIEAEMLNRMAYIRLTDAADCEFSK